MDEKGWRRVQEILQEALEATQDQREEQLGAESAEVRAEVEAILRAHDEAESSAEGGAIMPRPGTTIDRYLVLREIGAGGFGVVYLAEQIEPVRRQVALKIVKLGMDTKQVVARFEAERQALALMDHPCIAKVLDGGATQAGRPYFVMELVDGKPITEYCDEMRLDTAERLSLFTLVCQAVQHAHQKGVIHRDIKPSNVLVTLQDGKPVPKVIDFGIARAVDQRLTERTVFTQVGQIVGTPEYMPPEQAGGEQDVDTRADVYSLGVLLYELLTGSKPFDLKALLEQGLGEILRTIREVDPPRPSTRISTMGDLLPEVAANRHTPPRLLRRVVRGDLDWIVMKAIEKDRERRYDSATALAMDVQNYLTDNPVSAGPPSRIYRLRKYVRRHRVGVSAAAAVAAALVVGLVVALGGLSEARHQAEIARDEADKAGKTLGIVQGILASADPHEVPDPGYTVRRMLDDFEPELASQLEGQPEVAAAIRSTMGTTYLGLGLPDKAQPHLESALEIRQELLAADHLDVAASLDDWAALLHTRGRYAPAVEAGRQSLDIRERVLGPDHEAVAESKSNLGIHLMGMGLYGEAEKRAREALALRGMLLGDGHRHTAHARNNLAAILKGQGKLAEAETRFREALATYESLSPDGHPDTAKARHNLASLLCMKGQTYDAEEEYLQAIELSKTVLDAGHPAVALTKSNLADELTTRRTPEALQRAETLLAEALVSLKAAYGDVHPQVAMTLKRQAALRQAQGPAHFSRAEDLFKDAIRMQQELLAEDHPVVARSRLALGNLYVRMGKPREAAKQYRYAQRVFEDAFGPVNPFLANTHALQAWLQKLLGNEVEAERLARAALEMRIACMGEVSTLVAADHWTLAVALMDMHKLDEAEDHLDEALEIRVKELGEDHPFTIETRHSAGILLLKQRAQSRAEPLLRDALERGERVLAEESEAIPRYRHGLAAALMLQDELVEAESMERAAIRRQVALGDAQPVMMNRVSMMMTLARILTLRGRYQDAEEINAAALDLVAGMARPPLRQSAFVRLRLGVSRAHQGKLVEAEELLRPALADARRAVRRTPRKLTEYLDGLALTCMGLDKLEEAEDHLKHALELHAEAQDVDTATTTAILAQVRSLQGDHAGAQPLGERAFEFARDDLGDDHSRLLTFQLVRADLLAESDNAPGAEPIFRALLARRGDPLDDGHPVFANALWGLGRCLFAQGKYDEAEKVLHQAVESLPGEGRAAWSRYDARSVRGECLVRLDRVTEGEPLLRDAYEKMEPPPVRAKRKLEALARLNALADE